MTVITTRILLLISEYDATSVFSRRELPCKSPVTKFQNGLNFQWTSHLKGLDATIEKLSHGVLISIFADSHHVLYQNADCHNSVSNHLLLWSRCQKFGFLGFWIHFVGQKVVWSLEKAQKSRWLPISTQISCTIYIGQYALQVLK